MRILALDLGKYKSVACDLIHVPASEIRLATLLSHVSFGRGWCNRYSAVISMELLRNAENCQTLIRNYIGES